MSRRKCKQFQQLEESWYGRIKGGGYTGKNSPDALRAELVVKMLKHSRTIQ